MKRPWSWLAISGGLVLGALAGCHSTPVIKEQPVQTVQAAPPSPPAAEVTTAYAKDLPATESAKLCLTTATQMDRSGAEVPAIQLYEKARASNPRYQHVAHRLAVLYDRQGMFAKSLEEYQKALKLAPRDADLLNDMGYSHYNHGKFKEAEDFLRLALQENPKHERAWVNLGLTLAMQEKYGDSLDAFQRAVPPAQAHCNLGFALTAQKKREEAMQEYRKALRLDPHLGLAKAALKKLENPDPPSAPRADAAAKPTTSRGPIGGGWAVESEQPQPAPVNPPRPLPALP